MRKLSRATDGHLQAVLPHVLADDFEAANLAMEAALNRQGRKAKHVYYSLINDCIEMQEMEATGWFCGHMMLSGLKLTEETVAKVASASAQRDGIRSVMRWWDGVSKHGVGLCLDRHKMIVKACCRERTTADIDALVGRMAAETGTLTLSISCYTAIINMFADAGDICNSEAWFDALRKAGHKTDCVVFNILIKACSRASNPQLAEHWYERMLHEGITPDMFTFNTLINASGQVGMLDRAAKWFYIMEATGEKGDLVSFASLLRACVQSGDAVSAQFWIEEMSKRGIQPNEASLTLALRASAQARDFNRGLLFFNLFSRTLR